MNMTAHETKADIPAQSDPREHWAGAWIWPEDVEADRNVYGLFRRTFESKAPAALEIHITADNFYTLYLDSQFVHRGPARAHLRYYSFDSFTLSIEMSHSGFWEELDFRRYPHGWMNADFDGGGWREPFIIGTPPDGACIAIAFRPTDRPATSAASSPTVPPCSLTSVPKFILEKQPPFAVEQPGEPRFGKRGEMVIEGSGHRICNYHAAAGSELRDRACRLGVECMRLREPENPVVRGIQYPVDDPLRGNVVVLQPEVLKHRLESPMRVLAGTIGLPLDCARRQGGGKRVKNCDPVVLPLGAHVPRAHPEADRL